MAVVGVLGARSAWQLQHWRNTEALFRHVLSVDPDNYMAHNQLGVISWNADKIADAEKHFEEAIEADTSFVLARRNLGLLRLRQNRTDEALTQFNEAGDWGDGPSLLEAAQIFLRQGEGENALEACEKAIAMGEQSSTAWTMRGVLLLGQKKFDEAEPVLIHAISLDPNNGRAYQHLAVAYLQQGKLDKARLQFAYGASLEPAIADDVEKLVEQSKEQDPILLDISAACLSQVEKFGVACRRIEAALKLAFIQGRTDLIPGMQSRLRAYLNDQTYLEFSVTQLPGS
ncbi:tetratricopeptide repeat protein [bacterium]|nr:tetratricopeptide repeat protein [bacterium]